MSDNFRMVLKGEEKLSALSVTKTDIVSPGCFTLSSGLAVPSLFFRFLLSVFKGI